jgi:hypothetical protein
MGEPIDRYIDVCGDLLAVRVRRRINQDSEQYQSEPEILSRLAAFMSVSH